MTALNETEVRRLAWRCRRGMLEMDIVLQRFVAEQFNGLTAIELEAFDALLDLPDNVFWDLIISKQDAGLENTQKAVIAKIRQAVD